MFLSCFSLIVSFRIRHHQLWSLSIRPCSEAGPFEVCISLHSTRWTLTAESPKKPNVSLNIRKCLTKHRTVQGGVSQQTFFPSQKSFRFAGIQWILFIKKLGNRMFFTRAWPGQGRTKRRQQGTVCRPTKRKREETKRELIERSI